MGVIIVLDISSDTGRRYNDVYIEGDERVEKPAPLLAVYDMKVQHEGNVYILVGIYGGLFLIITYLFAMGGIQSPDDWVHLSKFSVVAAATSSASCLSVLLLVRIFRDLIGHQGD